MDIPSNNNIKIIIETNKNYYYPGDTVIGNIHLYTNKINKNNNIILTVKGVERINASQSREAYIEKSKKEKDDEDCCEEFEDEDFFEDYYGYEEKEREDSRGDNIENEESEEEDDNKVKKIRENKIILKKKINIDIFENNKVAESKYLIPFEFVLPASIPPSFLYMEKNIYAEILYKVKAKFEDKKAYHPLTIRQLRENFNCPITLDTTKSIGGCCCEGGFTKMKVTLSEPFFETGNKIRLNVHFDNNNNTISGGVVTLDLYRKLVLHPKKKKNQKIIITKNIGRFSGSKAVPPKSHFNENFALYVKDGDYLSDNIEKSMSFGVYKSKDYLPFLTQSIRSELIRMTYEVYVESIFEGAWDSDEVGLFIPVLLFAKEKNENFEGQKFIEGVNKINKTIIKFNDDIRKKSGPKDLIIKNKNSYVYQINNKKNENGNVNKKENISNSINSGSFRGEENGIRKEIGKKFLRDNMDNMGDITDDDIKGSDN